MSTVGPGALPGIGNSQVSYTNTARLSSAAKEFESVLLGQWLKDAESSFGSVPGSEEDDAGGEQMKEFAMQHVAAEFTNRGGIGIASMVEKALAASETTQTTNAKKAAINSGSAL
jgi:Rod binding domain-containing protein